MRNIILGQGLPSAALIATTAAAGTLSGFVMDSAGKPINGAMVRLTNSDNVSESVFTSAKGDS